MIDRAIQRKAAMAARRGSGGVFATLFFALACAGVVAFTELRLVPRDRLAGQAPATAVIYVHAAGAGVDRLLAASITMPTGVAPSEAIAFAVPREDGSLSWGSALAWPAFSRPSAEELAALAERGFSAHPSRTNVFLGGDQAAFAPQTARFPKTDAARAVRSMLGVAPIVAYVDLPALAADDLPPWTAGYAIAPVVAAVSLGTEGFSAAVAPAAVAARYPAWLGFAAPSGVSARPADPLPPNALLGIAESIPSFNAFALIALRLEDERVRRGIPSGVGLSDAAARLNALLKVPYSTTLAVDPAGERLRFLFRYPDIEPEQVRKTIADYLSALWPRTERVLLPDGDVVVEYVADADRYSFVPAAVPGAPDAEVIAIDEASFDLFVGSDGRGGSSIASDASSLAEWIADAKGRRTPACPPAGRGDASIEVRRPAILFADQSLLLPFMNAYAGSRLVITSSGEVIYACGYSFPAVDNIGTGP